MFSIIILPAVRDHLPLKQGLRLYDAKLSKAGVDASQRPSSITTRLKENTNVHE